jgi:hypothetical protein
MELVIAFVLLHLIVPILGLVWLGHYRERRQLQYELRSAIKQFNTLAISRGSRSDN